MKKLIVLTLAFILVVPILTFASDVYVHGYWKDTNHDGVKDTYVQPYHRTSPDNTIRNNYDYPGNYNPNSGQITPGNPYESSHKHKSTWD